jgi:protein-tyrosine phosphatase
MKLCDVHTHILPGVDDGAPTMEYALPMLENALASDVEWLAVTPHWRVSAEDSDAMRARLRADFRQLQEAAAAMPIHLVIGAEVRVTDTLMTALPPNGMPTLNDSRYLLTEFAPDTDGATFLPVLEQLMAAGYIPLVAHPERYAAVCRDPRIVQDWLDCGCHLQLTGGSIQGNYGKTIQHAAAFLLQQDFVACVASDAHGLHHRSNFLLDVYDHLSLRYSKHYAQCLMYENPIGICCDNDI